MTDRERRELTEDCPNEGIKDCDDNCEAAEETGCSDC